MFMYLVPSGVLSFVVLSTLYKASSPRPSCLFLLRPMADRNPDKRPLPSGWIEEYDPSYKTWFYVDTRRIPPASSWTHPAALAPPPPGPPPQQYAAPTTPAPPNVGNPPPQGYRNPSPQGYRNPPPQGQDYRNASPQGGCRNPSPQPYGNYDTPPQGVYGQGNPDRYRGAPPGGWNQQPYQGQGGYQQGYQQGGYQQGPSDYGYSGSSSADRGWFGSGGSQQQQQQQPPQHKSGFGMGALLGVGAAGVLGTMLVEHKEEEAYDDGLNQGLDYNDNNGGGNDDFGGGDFGGGDGF